MWLGGRLGVEFVAMQDSGGFDLLLSIHWHKIIPKEFLKDGCSYNVHPCLFKYKGHDPIARYIANGDTLGSVGIHAMTEIVDEGKLLHEEYFPTPKINSYQEFYDIALPYYFKGLSYSLEIIEQCG
jgi:methionyl-tRNA formyltransferase